MLQIIIAIVIALLAWVIFKPEWMPQPPENEVTQKVDTGAKQLKDKSGGWFKKLKSWLPKKSNLGIQLKAWMLQPDLAKNAGLSRAQMDELAECQLWLSKAGDKEAQAIAIELGGFCREHGINLAWLLEDGGSADMRAALSGLAIYFLQAVKEREDARPVAALRTWEEAPLAKENREFGNRLYMQLVDAKIIEVPTHILLAKDKVRKTHLVSSIKAVLPTRREEIIPFAALALNTEIKAAPEKPKAQKKNKKEAAPEEQADA